MPRGFVRLLAVDIDGCLVPIEHAAFDLQALAEVAALNRLSRSDPLVPPLTIVSGRPHPYVDALMQLLDITAPAVFENGAGLAIRNPYGVRYRDEALRGREALECLRHELEKRGGILVQPGKEASLTAFPAGPEVPLAEVADAVDDAIGRHGLDLVAEDAAHECINVLVPGVDKGLGLSWLAEEMGLRLEQMAGIGDSAGDLPWLTLCGFAAAPANADPRLREHVDLDSAEADVAAVLELYRLVIEANRGLMAARPETGDAWEVE